MNADLKEKRKIQWDTIFKEKWLAALVPPRLHTWVLEKYLSPQIKAMASQLKVMSPQVAIPRSIYYGYEDRLQGYYHGYAVLFNLAERLWINVGGYGLYNFETIDFSAWVNTLKGSPDAEISRSAIYRSAILLAYGLPSVRGTAWEHKELVNLFHNRHIHVTTTIWIGPAELNEWARNMDEISLQSYVVRECDKPRWIKGLLPDTGKMPSE